MAIIQGLPGLEVTVFTNGCTAKEYDDPSETDGADQRPQVVTKYIECKDNEPFRIHLKATDEYPWGFKDHVLNFGAVIDGIWAKGDICRQEYTNEEDWERDISYRVVRSPNNYARYVLQEFAFSSIIKTDDFTAEQHDYDMEKMERLGTIEVEVRRTTILQGDGPISVPVGDHPKDFTMSREAVRGKAKSHGTKFTRTQAAVKPRYVRCSTITEDNGPIAIFRFKYRSRVALELEGIIPDLLQPLDWLVEIADDEKDRDKRRNSEHRRQGPLSNNEQAERKMKKEKESNGNNIAPDPSSSATGQNINTKPVDLSQRNRFHIRTLTTGSGDPSLILRIKVNSKQWKDSLNKIKSSYHQARPGAASQESDPQPAASIRPHLNQKVNRERQVAQGAFDKTSAHGKSREDDNNVALVQETKTPPGLRPCDMALPSVEGAADATKVKTKSKKKNRSENDRISTQSTGKTSVPGGGNQGSIHSTVTATGNLRHGLGAPSSATQSLKAIPKAKDENLNPADRSKEECVRHLQEMSETERRDIERREALRRNIDLIIHRQMRESKAAPIPSSFPLQTRTISATNLLRSLLPQPPPSLPMSNQTPTSNHAKPAPPLNGFLPPLSVTPNLVSTSNTITNNRTANPNISTVPAASIGAEKKAAPKAVAKRKANEAADIGSGRPIYRPHPAKKPKTHNAREIIELSDSE